MTLLSPGRIVTGYQTRTVAALAAELVARAETAMELGAVEVEITLKRSATKYSDTGEMRDSVSVEPFGGFAGIGASEVGMIAAASARHAEWVDKGTTGGTALSTRFTPVGKRAPNRRNAPPQFQGITTFASLPVNGQEATHWFSAPFSRPLGEVMREQYRRFFTRLR